MSGKSLAVVQICAFSADQKVQVHHDLKALDIPHEKESYLLDTCTHLISAGPKLDEKFLCACAQGIWVLKPSFVEACKASQTGWARESDHEWSEADVPASQATNATQRSLYALPALRRRRPNRQPHDQQQQPPVFYNWKVIVLHNSAQRIQMFSRLLCAGGATVVPVTAEVPLTSIPDDVTHVFCDMAADGSLQAEVCTLYADCERRALKQVDFLATAYIVQRLLDVKSSAEHWRLAWLSDSLSSPSPRKAPKRRLSESQQHEATSGETPPLKQQKVTSSLKRNSSCARNLTVTTDPGGFAETPTNGQSGGEPWRIIPFARQTSSVGTRDAAESVSAAVAVPRLLAVAPYCALPRDNAPSAIIRRFRDNEVETVVDLSMSQRFEHSLSLLRGMASAQRRPTPRVSWLLVVKVVLQRVHRLDDLAALDEAASHMSLATHVLGCLRAWDLDEGTVSQCSALAYRPGSDDDLMGSPERGSGGGGGGSASSVHAKRVSEASRRQCGWKLVDIAVYLAVGRQRDGTARPAQCVATTTKKQSGYLEEDEDDADDEGDDDAEATPATFLATSVAAAAAAAATAKSTAVEREMQQIAVASRKAELSRVQGLLALEMFVADLESDARAPVQRRSAGSSNSSNNNNSSSSSNNKEGPLMRQVLDVHKMEGRLDATVQNILNALQDVAQECCPVRLSTRNRWTEAHEVMDRDSVRLTRLLHRTITLLYSARRNVFFPKLKHGFVTLFAHLRQRVPLSLALFVAIESIESVSLRTAVVTAILDGPEYGAAPQHNATVPFHLEKLISFYMERTPSRTMATVGTSTTASTSASGTNVPDATKSTFAPDTPSKAMRKGVNACNQYGESQLMLACKKKPARAPVEHIAKRVQDLLGKGANVHLRCYDDLTPLHEACVSGQYLAVSLLLDAGVDAHAIGKNGETAIGLAQANGHEECVRRLMAHGAGECDPLACHEYVCFVDVLVSAALHMLSTRAPPRQEEERVRAAMRVKVREMHTRLCAHSRSLAGATERRFASLSIAL